MMIIHISSLHGNRLPYISLNPIILYQLLSFPKNHFKKSRQRPLTPLMIKTLLAACEKQNKSISFGPQDIKGSAMTLINRGLIASHIINRKGKSQETWYVTQQAINMLLEMGIKVSC